MTNIILGSQSPRRSDLLKAMGIDFRILIPDIDESVPENTPHSKAAKIIAKNKAKALLHHLKEDDILITADTTVILEDKILGKPTDLNEAMDMLRDLSGKKHLVITGVCISTKSEIYSFSVETEVYFKVLKPDDISYYVRKFKPLDKAGSYGIQEWIGWIGIDKINGSYSNIMGLPSTEVFECLRKLMP